MVSFAELLGDQTQGLIKDTVKVGNVYRLNLDRKSGIIPKPGDLTRNKFFVVLGFDADGNIYGGVIFNSGINPNISTLHKMYHMPIKADDYNFLDHDSFVDCLTLITASPEEFVAGSYLGDMTQDHMDLIIDTVKESPLITQQTLIDYGIL